MKEQAVRIKSTHQEEFCGSGQQFGAVVGEKGAVMSIPGNEGRIALAWVNVRGGMRMFAAYLWHTEGWFPRNEAFLEAVLKRQEPKSIHGW